MPTLHERLEGGLLGLLLAEALLRSFLVLAANQLPRASTACPRSRMAASVIPATS